MSRVRVFGRIRSDGTARFVELFDYACAELDTAPWLGGRATGRRWPRAGLELVAPVVPTKIVCVGLNYREHIAESVTAPTAEPLLFLKPPSAVVGPGAA